MFKPGDSVKCIRQDEDYGLELYRVYTIIETAANGGNVRIDGAKPRILWESNRFTLVPSKIESIQQATLPIDSKERKDFPIFSGCVRYFPAALAGVAKTSKLGNDKHNPGEELHHARGKSMDHGDCVIRHLMDVEDLLAKATRDGSPLTPKAIEDILTEVNQMAWRALAFSQELHEKFGAPLAPGAKK